MIEFRALGSLDLRGPDGGEILSVLAQPKRTALLAYLAVASPRGFQRRDTLAALFWPHGDQEHARAALRKAVHYLRKSLGEDVLLNRGDEEIGLDWGQLACDVVAFQEALDHDELQRALDTYRGDLMEGFILSGCPGFDRWLEAERIRLRQLAAGAAWSLAHGHLAAGRIVDGERMGQRALSHVCTDESEARKFVETLADAGDRAAAVRFYQRFAQVLQETLELEPSGETKALVEKIRGSSLDGSELMESTGERGPPGGAEMIPGAAEGTVEGSAAAEELAVGDESIGAQAEGADLEPLVQKEIGEDLHVLREIGGGPGARVFIARENSLDRLVAIKVLSEDFARDPVAKIRFEREARVAASLGHPNAVAVHRFGWLADGIPFLVMQYVNGPTLEEKLAAEGPLPVPLARAVLAQVAGALAEAHRKGFVHRDVSTQNILWDRENDRALLTDFGLAGLLPRRQGSMPRVTKKGEVLGSPGYSSPEQLKGEEPTEGTDIYALGILGYEILTGESPFRAETIPEAAQAHLHWTPRPLANLRPDVADDLAGLVERCLAKDPRKRPRADYLANAFSRPGQGSTQGTDPSSREALRRPYPRFPRPWRRLLRILAILAASGAVIFLLIQILAPS